METRDTLLNQSRDRGARLRSVVTLLRITSTGVALATILLVLVAAAVLDDSLLMGMALILIGTAVAGAAIAGFVMADRLEKTTRRHLARSASQAMMQDPRPPVLYLRSFHDEPHTQRVRLRRRFWERDVAEEELLASEIAKVGPFIAVGRPGDDLPQIGANRLYVDDADWASVVLRLMEEAAGVLIRIGPGGGLAWEIRQAVQRLSPERLAFLIPCDMQAYSFFKWQTDPLLPHPLPWYPHEPWMPAPPPGFNLLGYLHFGPDWSPRLELFVFGASGSQSEKAIRRAFSRSLAPFVSRLMPTAPPSDPRTDETAPSGPSPQGSGPVRSILSVLWALLPALPLGVLTPLLAPFPCAYAAVRLGERRPWLFSAAYGLASLTLLRFLGMAADRPGTPAVGIIYASLLALGVVATMHAFRLRRRVFAAA